MVVVPLERSQCVWNVSKVKIGIVFISMHRVHSMRLYIKAWGYKHALFSLYTVQKASPCFCIVPLAEPPMHADKNKGFWVLLAFSTHQDFPSQITVFCMPPYAAYTFHIDTTHHFVYIGKCALTNLKFCFSKYSYRSLTCRYRGRIVSLYKPFLFYSLTATSNWILSWPLRLCGFFVELGIFVRNLSWFFTCPTDNSQQVNCVMFECDCVERNCMEFILVIVVFHCRVWNV